MYKNIESNRIITEQLITETIDLLETYTCPDVAELISSYVSSSFHKILYHKYDQEDVIEFGIIYCFPMFKFVWLTMEKDEKKYFEKDLQIRAIKEFNHKLIIFILKNGSPLYSDVLHLTIKMNDHLLLNWFYVNGYSKMI